MVRFASLLLAASSLLPAGALAAAAPADPAPAADAAADAQGLETIVVTAQKRKEDLQTTPISISVLSAQGLENRHVTSLLDLGDGAIPSLKVAPFYSRNSALIVNIRGVGVLSDGNQPARDQGVGVYVDGVYMGRAQGLGTALFEVENLEVLKGPQGTLFGRNTEGGAVNITSKKPTGKFGMNATAGLGNYGQYKAEAHMDLPEFHNISLKLDGVVAHRGALISNPLPGAYGFNYYNKRGMHAEALWKPTNNFTADYSFDWSYDASTSLYLQSISGGSYKTAALAVFQPTRADAASVGVPEQPSVGKTTGNRLTLEWQPAGKLTLKSISAYRELRQSQYDNGSASTTMMTGVTSANPTGSFLNAPFARYSLAQFRQNQASQEFQAIGEIPTLKYVAGLLWYQEKVQDNAQAFYTNTFSDAAGSAYTINSLVYDKQQIDRASHVTTSSLGAFGQATWTPRVLEETLHLTGGLRWTKDAKHGSLFWVNGAWPVNRAGVSAPIPLDASWSRVDPMVNLAYDVTRDLHLYGKWSTGYKSGGANSRAQQYDAFNPETVSMFEIGAKTEFWQHRARFNIAAYAGTYKNIQVDFSRPYESNGKLTTRTTTSTINAPGTGGLHGVEAEFTLAPVQGLMLHASYAYTYVRIPATVNPYPNSAGVLSTLAVPIYQTYTPKHAASVAADYEYPLAGAKARLHIDANYDSGYYVNNNDPAYYGVGDARNLYQPKGDSAFIVNGRLSLADIAVNDTGARVAFAIWARNLCNEQHLFYKTYSPSVGTSGFFNEARTFGGEVNVKF